MRLWKTNSLAILGTCSMILQFLQGTVFAGPVRRSSRMIREVYPEIEPEKLEGNQAEVCIVGDVVYGADEPVPADQPCLKCKCQPPGVQCETTKCVKKPGCRAIHKSNKCCPEYQCECEHEGRFYANGERLETPPGGECKVCYCRGGEVQCAEVSCYIRTDCEGRTVSGQCCPKYDHCPPRGPLNDRVISYATQNASLEDRLTTAFYDIHEITNNDNNKITESQTKPSFVEPTDLQAASDTLEETNAIHVHEIHLATKATQTDPLDVPKITIQEIIPEIKEIPITGAPKREIDIRAHEQVFAGDLAEQFLNEAGEIYQDKENNVSDLAMGDTESDSSEISEVYHHPPPVLKIGDQLLFLKKGELVPGQDMSTPVPVITIIGAEGLQRGIEDSGEFPAQEGMGTIEESEKQARTHIISLVKPRSNTDDTTPDSLPTIHDFLLNLTKTTMSDDDFFSESVDPSTSMLAETVINRIKSLANVETTTDLTHLIQTVFINDLNTTEDYTNSSSSDGSIDEKWNESNDNTSIAVTSLERMETLAPTPSDITVKQNTTDSRYEDLGEAKELNPEYPPIPDVMSPQNLEEQLSDHLDSESQAQEHISSFVTAVISTESALDGNLTTTGEISAKQEWLKNTTQFLKSLINLKSTLPTSLLQEIAPSDVQQDEVIDNKRNEESTDRSKETIEDYSVESGEATTPQNKRASILSSENISIETTSSAAEEKDMIDLVEMINGTEHNKSVTNNSMEKEDKTKFINNSSLGKDVEDTKLVKNLQTQPKELRDEESEKIFQQLNEELKTVPTFIDHKGDTDAEAEAIFRELLEEATSSTLSPSKETGKIGFFQGRPQESQLLQKVSEAISKFQLQESKESLDTSILGILKDFFSAQYYDAE